MVVVTVLDDHESVPRQLRSSLLFCNSISRFFFFFPLSFQFPRGSKFVLSSIIYRTIVDYTRDRNIGTSSLCLPQGKYSGKGGIFEERDMTLICLQESWNRKINIFPLSSNSFQDKDHPPNREDFHFPATLLFLLLKSRN